MCTALKVSWQKGFADEIFQAGNRAERISCKTGRLGLCQTKVVWSAKNPEWSRASVLSAKVLMPLLVVQALF